MNIDATAPVTKFNQEYFHATLTKIAQLASATEHSTLGPVQEFEMLRNCGALEVVLPGGALDFNKPDMPALLKLLKDVGKANLSVGRIFEGHINTLYLIHLYASTQQQEKWYDGVKEKGDLFGIWNTQGKDGIQVYSSSDSFTISGNKTFCSGASLVSKALITGNIETPERAGWQMLIVDMEKIGKENIDAESWKPLGMKASGSYQINFTGYTFQGSDFLGQPGIYLNQPHFSGGAIRFAAVQLGGAEAIMEGTIDYLKTLNRTDDPFQQLRISNICSEITSGRLWLKQSGKYYDEWVDDDTRKDDLIAFANMTRVNIEESCLKIMEESNRCVGARGLMAPYSLERIFRDLSFYLRQPAPDATRLKIAEFFIQNPGGFHD
ncbi:acyl-CoA dehydrogenase family protein [Pedobacter frigidisoli]|uniref:acyl-CoA dehydrogenase family protein n=1 Tax=Pedobacter frigidisoli TaxID=2530455 RepID=UPI00292E9974|nr:acyl-CoA dehydrogenase family protein [Pedobacter frigidisoli]